ncbi:MAG TPA: outer membrane beta-barrel protein [Methylocystis sp.]|nr:outer membrane beta-barrel protein [Methylocystis sp.]HXZ15263.1 outer membrane beta-barrel protein [Roseiarcus sp.]
MKKTPAFCAAVALACSVGPTLAADLPSVKEPVVIPPPPPAWTGFYFGGNVGAAFDASPGVTTSPFPLYNDVANTVGLSAGTYFGTASAASIPTNGNVSGAGVIGGGQVGFNWQFGALVAGLEADIQGTAQGGYENLAGAAVEPVTQSTITSTASLNKTLNYLGTVRARVGFLITPTLLLFGSGGLAYGGMGFSVNVTQTSSTSVFPASAVSAYYNDAQIGWSVGGGAEWLFWPNWSAKLEYLYYDLGTQTASIAFAGPTTSSGGSSVVLYAAGYQSSTRFNGHVVRAGVNYHFQWFKPATVVAKY